MQVMLQARSFLGFGPSTFSFFVAQFRTLHGRPLSSTALISGRGILPHYVLCNSTFATYVEPQQ